MRTREQPGGNFLDFVLAVVNAIGEISKQEAGDAIENEWKRRTEPSTHYVEVSIRELETRGGWGQPALIVGRPREKFLWDCYQQFRELFPPTANDDNVILMRRSELEALVNDRPR